MAARDCIGAMEKAMGRPPTEAEIESISLEVQARLRAKMDAGFTAMEAARKTAAELTDEAKLATARARWVQYDNLMKKNFLRETYERTPRGEAEMLDGRSSGIGPMSGRGVTTVSHSLRDNVLYPMQTAIDKAGLRKLANSRDAAWERDLAQEMYRRDDPTLAPDTGNAQAKTVARALGDALDASRAMQNKEGAFIGKKEGYMGRQNWDMFKARGDNTEAAFAKWKETFGKNRSADFEGLAPEQIEALLRHQWEAIKSGVFDSRNIDARGAFSLANKVSRERTINFDTPAAWVEANRIYGRGGIVEGVYAQVEQGARNAALMQRFGTTPQRMWNEIHAENMRDAAKEGNDGAVTMMRYRLNDQLFQGVSGLYDKPGSHSLATIGANVRSVTTLLKLGSLMTQAIVHIPLDSLVLRRNGVNFLEAMANQLRYTFPPTEAGREMASAAHAGLDGMFGGIVRRFHTEDGAAGSLTGAVNTFYKAIGFGPFMDNQRAGVGIALTHILGRNAGREFGALPARSQISLGRYGIGAAEWDTARVAVRDGADGRKYVIPSEIEDPKVAAKFQDWVTGEIAEGANEPSAWARNLAAFGSQPGTLGGEITRTIMQFKSFAYTMAQRQWGANMRGGMDVPGIMLLASMATAFGFISGELSGVLKNETLTMPKDGAGWTKLALDSMHKGGAFGLLADSFARDGVKSGGDWLRGIMGPTLGPVADVASIITELVRGPEPGSQTQSRAKILSAGARELGQDLAPNFWALQAAYNYLTPYMIANMFKPGAVQRHEQLMRKHDRAYILPPGH